MYVDSTTPPTTQRKQWRITTPYTIYKEEIKTSMTKACQ
jgi:hypothetical protein